jgi:hypothetical protein
VTSPAAATTPLRNAGNVATAAATRSARWLVSAEAAFFLAATGIYLLFRAGSFVFTAVRVTDTPTYEQVSGASIFGSGFWAGQRPFTVPLLWKLLSDDGARIVAHGNRDVRTEHQWRHE